MYNRILIILEDFNPHVMAKPGNINMYPLGLANPRNSTGSAQKYPTSQGHA